MRRLLLGPHIERIQRLESVVEGIREESKKAREELEEMKRRIAELESRVAELEDWIEVLGDESTKKSANSNARAQQGRQEQLVQVYSLIKRGCGSPTELSRTLGISLRELYEILGELKRRGLVMSEGKGKHRRYIPR